MPADGQGWRSVFATVRVARHRSSGTLRTALLLP
jgi:hypothetical protein